MDGVRLERVGVLARDERDGAHGRDVQDRVKVRNRARRLVTTNCSTI